ncbi:MAG: hypothetical protein AAGA25_12515 [Planctomycetota bacterium]
MVDEQSTQDTSDEQGPDFEVRPARYCRSCGFDLTLIDVSPCPGCEKEFDPEDDSTTRGTPLPTQGNFYFQRPRVAGYGLLVWFILGRPIIHFVGNSLGGRFADLVIGLGVILLVPWILVGVMLAFETTEEHHNPKLVVTLPLGAAFGVLLTFGLHPALTVVGAIVGGFGGFLRAYREA